MSGVNLIQGVRLSPGQVTDTGWKLVGTADFNADGRTDLLWRHDQGLVAIWFMDGGRQIAGTLVTSSPLSDLGWRIVATGDVDGDGKPDILWQHTDGRVAVWYMDDWRNRLGDVFVSLSDLSWRVVGASDVNGDRRLDLVWHHATRGDVAVWFMADKVVLDAVQRKCLDQTPTGISSPSAISIETALQTSFGRTCRRAKLRHGCSMVHLCAWACG